MQNELPTNLAPVVGRSTAGHADGMPEQPAPSMTDHDIRASGLMSEAFERIERARGALYDLHQLIGGADGQLDDVVAELRKGGHDELADDLERDLIGLDVLDGRWTFQVVEEFDDGYYARWRELEERVRQTTVGGRRHVLEARMKDQRQT